MIVVAEADGQIVGFAHACEYRLLYQPPMMNLMGIAVDAEYRGKGIGHALLTAIEDAAREHGVSGIRVISGIGRDEAHRFYRAVGYADAGESKKFLKRL
ncbi:MAG: GNAT family N-acetyltransferase [Clostridia bacterium]|nr:GNAT family N-acetyltransferase [Clostridia bacterium]